MSVRQISVPARCTKYKDTLHTGSGRRQRVSRVLLASVSTYYYTPEYRMQVTGLQRLSSSSQRTIPKRKSSEQFFFCLLPDIVYSYQQPTPTPTPFFSFVLTYYQSCGAPLLYCTHTAARRRRAQVMSSIHAMGGYGQSPFRSESSDSEP